MNRYQHLLVRGMEECNEIAQRISKALVFGMEEVQPDEVANPKRLTNRQRIILEYNDLIAVLQLLGLDVQDAAMQAAKKEKVRKYLAYSQSVGELSEQPTEDK